MLLTTHFLSGDLPPMDPLEAAERLMHVLAKMISGATWLKCRHRPAVVILRVIWGVLKMYAGSPVVTSRHQGFQD